MFEALGIPGLRLYQPQRHADERGYFVETWSERVFTAQGLPGFVQDNEAFSRIAGTVRGLHFQTPPHAQAKLLRCIAGTVFDVVVDIRRGSPTFGKHFSMELRPESGSLFVPIGLAHGYCTTAPETVMQYKVSAPHAPAHESGIAWDDPALGIPWPVHPASAVLSDKDRAWPRLADVSPPFGYEISRP